MNVNPFPVLLTTSIGLCLAMIIFGVSPFLEDLALANLGLAIGIFLYLCIAWLAGKLNK